MQKSKIWLGHGGDVRVFKNRLVFSSVGSYYFCSIIFLVVGFYSSDFPYLFLVCLLLVISNKFQFCFINTNQADYPTFTKKIIEKK